MRDFPRHFFASSTSSRVNSSVASYAFSQSCDDQDRSGTWSNLGETFGQKPWKMKKTWEKWGKNGKHMGKPCSLQWKVRKTGKPSRIMGKLLKSLFSSLKFNVCRWRSPLFFYHCKRFSWTMLQPDICWFHCHHQSHFVAYSDPSLFSVAPLEMYFEQFTPYLLDCTFHVLCGIQPTMLQIIIDSSKSVVE